MTYIYTHIYLFIMYTFFFDIGLGQHRADPIITVLTQCESDSVDSLDSICIISMFINVSWYNSQKLKDVSK